jgi:hypothetical protein
MRSRFWILSLLAAVFAAVPLAGVAGAQGEGGKGTPECLLKVFGTWCLGGPIPEGYKQKEGEIYVYDGDDGHQVILNAFAGRTMSVSRLYRPDGWDVYRDLLARLTTKYGPGEDRSEYPGYAKDDSTREIAIGAQSGSATHYWDQGDWFLMLLWSRRGGITVSYYHKALHSESLAAADDL